MIFQIEIAVLRAVPEQRDWIPQAEVAWHDTVEYTLGIQAADATEARRIAAQAAANAVDRDGAFIGGVVTDIRLETVTAKDFDGYEDYLLQPIDTPGIFYVSGVTHSSTSEDLPQTAIRDLEVIRAQIEESGLPAASFVHPKPKEIRYTTLRAYAIQIYYAPAGLFMNTNHESDDLEALKQYTLSDACDGFRLRVVDAAGTVVFEPPVRERKGDLSLRDLAAILHVPMAGPPLDSPKNDEDEETER